MKKIIKKIALLLIVFCIGVGVTLLYTNNKYGVYEKEETKQIKKHVDTISMMLETEAKSGNYERTTRESWPTELIQHYQNVKMVENYHDSSLTNGAGDSSYRYSGANPNNYVMRVHVQ